MILLGRRGREATETAQKARRRGAKALTYCSGLLGMENAHTGG